MYISAVGDKHACGSEQMASPQRRRTGRGALSFAGGA